MSVQFNTHASSNGFWSVKFPKDITYLMPALSLHDHEHMSNMKESGYAGDLFVEAKQGCG